MLVDWPTIWSRGMMAICDRTASWMAASLAVDQEVDGESVNGLLFPVLLLLNFVFGVENCLVDEGGAVGESVWGEW